MINVSKVNPATLIGDNMASSNTVSYLSSKKLLFLTDE